MSKRIPDDITALRAEIEKLRAWIREDGEHTDTCTEWILNEICSTCGCGKAEKQKSLTPET